MSRSSRLAAVLASLALSTVVTACGQEAEEPSARSSERDTVTPTPRVTISPSPSSTVSVPAEATLTEVGQELSFGEPATVIYEPAKGQGTVLEITVDGVRRASIGDLSEFALDKKARKATPYYVDVSVQNVGEGNIGGVSLPLWGRTDSTKTLLRPTTFTAPFRRCPSEPLPDRFGPGRSVSDCLVYLAPERGDLRSVSFRPNEQFAVEWTGTVREPAKESRKPSKRRQGQDG